jgi:hypothetical protein
MGPLPAVIAWMCLAVLPVSGCGGSSSVPAGGGIPADARITPDNAATLTAVALGLGTGLDAFIGRATAGSAKAGTDGPFPLPADLVPPPVNEKDLRVVAGAENADVLVFDYLVPGPAGGQVRVYGSLWPDGSGALTTAFLDYGRGDGYTLDGTVTYLIVARDPANGRILAMDIRLSGFAMADAASDLRLEGEIGVSAPTPGRVVNRIDVEGVDRASGKAFGYRDFLLVRATEPGATGSAEDLTGEAFEGASGRLTVTTDVPLAYTGGLPVGGGPVRLAGAENTAARVTPLGDGIAELAVDGDGDGAFEDLRVVAWDALF